MGLAAVLDVAQPGDKIMLVSFGSGAGSDAFILEAQEALPRKRKNGISVRTLIENCYENRLRDIHEISRKDPPIVSFAVFSRVGSVLFLCY